MSRNDSYAAPAEGHKAAFERVLLDEIELIRERRRLLAEERRRRPATGRTAAADGTRADDEHSSQAPRATAAAAPGESSCRACEQALQEDLSGLSFSGGGIRSATFNLGILQALARLGLLARFDYLSTVSGGGYIGSWLTGLIHRASRKGEPAAVLDVEERLTTGPDEAPAASDSREGEDSAVRFLRRFSNYLTPNVGFFSADTWAVVTNYLRNLLLVQATLIAGIGLLLLVPRLVAALAEPLTAARWALGVALGLATFAVVVVGYNLGSSSEEGLAGWGKRGAAGEQDRRRPPLLEQAWVLWTVVVPLLLAAVGAALGLRLLGEEIGEILLEKARRLSGLELPLAARHAWLLTVFGTALAYSFSWVLGGCVAWARVKRFPKSIRLGELILWALPAGLLGGLLLFGIDQLFSAADATEAALGESLWRTLTWGAPAILLGYVLTASVHIGLVGRKLHDYHREWLSRVGAWLLLFAIAWAALFAVTVYGTPLVYGIADWLRWALTAGWLGATLAGILASRGRESDGTAGRLVRAVVARVAPYVFIVGLLLWLGVGIDRVLSLPAAGTPQGSDPWTAFMAERQGSAERQAGRPGDPGREARPEDSGDAGAVPVSFADLVAAHWGVLEIDGRIPLEALLGSLLAVFLLLGWRVDVNEFSMHRLYRNRLVRCYLAATQDAATRDDLRQPFTGFHLRDDIPLRELGPPAPGPPAGERPEGTGIYAGPYHLINTALNLVAGQELAWQERKAASFVFSPLYCGFGIPQLETGYRRTPGYGSEPKPLTLGTAMAISGAAASPNMGFRTSPALSFLLTVFNVRLGWWLGNPSQDRPSRNFARKPLWQLSGPSFAVTELVGELFGLTRQDKPFVYLSDGGHFENLGLYELVRRRCRFIVACDGGADPDLEFDDLGNAIRKCRVDLGIEIAIDPQQIRPGEEGLSRWHWAVGTIRYSEHEQGTLLYLKASLTGDEPEDLLNYEAQHREFPHQTTGDQWFDESQFESYRRLGEHVAAGALAEAVAEASHAGHVNLERLAQMLRERWHAPAHGVEGAFTRHSRQLDALYQTLRTSRPLAFLSEQFYPEWRSLMSGEPAAEAPTWLPSPTETGEEERRHGFFFCNQLIQLMEDVYLELDLEEQWDHPDNRGWMNLFKHWSWSGMFQVTWAICASNYGLRFQRFCLRRLGLDSVCRVEVVELTRGQESAPPLTLAQFDRLLEGRSEFNFVERDIIRDVLQHQENRIHRVFSFQVVVQEPMREGLDENHQVRFGCGFALVESQRIVCFRIQDHLRRMGLARRALKDLISMHRLAAVGKLVEMSCEHAKLFPRDSGTKLQQLFRSVMREVEQARGR